METPSKKELIKDVESIFQDTTSWIESQPEENFNKEMVKGKWTSAGHLYHLIKTSKGVTKGFSMPKLVLRMTFGVNNRTERTFEEQYQKYISKLEEILKNTGKQARPSNEYLPKEGREFDKDELLSRFEESKQNFIQAFEKISEKDLGKFVIPHPLIGKLTLREFTYFIIFHTKHQLDNLKENYEN